jgi:hypothetical protein
MQGRYIYALTDFSVEKRSDGWYFGKSRPTQPRRLARPIPLGSERYDDDRAGTQARNCRAPRAVARRGRGMSAAGMPPSDTIAEALSNMIDLADAWASAGPEGYTKEERQRRDRAECVLGRLHTQIERQRRPG